MQDIGQRLKEERLIQGKSIEDIMAQTRFSRTQIEAIENGDLDFFKEDLTYVKYYIQFYCKALKLDFNEFKDDFDDSMVTFTNMLTEKEVNELKRANEELAKKIKLNKNINSNKKTKRKKRRLKLDMALFSFLGIVIVLVLCLAFVFGRYVFPSLMNNQNDRPPIVTDPINPDDYRPITTTDSSNTQDETIDSNATISMIDANNYVISNYNENQVVTISLEFNARTWLDAYLDGKRVETPVSNKIYSIGEKIDYVIEAKNGSVLELRLGYINTNRFYLDNNQFELDSSLANLRGSGIIFIKFEGE